jgi:hypothetical protein
LREDFHGDGAKQGAFASDVKCEDCGRRLGGLCLVEGRIVHRDPAECPR